MSSPATEESWPAAGEELFSPPRWLPVLLLVSAGGALILAALSAVLPLPLAARLLAPWPLVALAVLALRAHRHCGVQYLVGDRQLTQLVRGASVRTIAFPEVREFREVPTLWGGRRVCLSHERGPLVIDLTFFGPHARRLFATLRYRLRPQFFRRVDEILTRGGRFVLRPGARLRLLVRMLVAVALAWLLIGSPIAFLGIAAATLLVLMQLDAASLVVLMDAQGLALRSLWRRRRVSPGHVVGVRFQSRTRLVGVAERVLVLDCGSFEMQIPDSVSEFEALAGALEGFSRRTEIKGLAQL